MVYKYEGSIPGEAHPITLIFSLPCSFNTSVPNSEYVKIASQSQKVPQSTLDVEE